MVLPWTVIDLIYGSGSLGCWGIWLADDEGAGLAEGGCSLRTPCGFCIWDCYLFLSFVRYPSTLNLSLLAFWSTIFENITR